MIKNFKTVISHPLFAGGTIMLVGSNIFNAGQFVYHIISGRLLGKIYYGDLAAIVSILGIIGIVQLSIGLTIIRFIASQKSKDKTANFIKWVNWWSLWTGIVVASLTFFMSPFLIRFLNIASPLSVYFLVPILLFFIVLNVHRSALQGLLRFDRYVLSLFAEGILKILLTIILVLAGFAIFGAMIGLFCGFLASFLVTRFSLAAYLRGKRGKRPDIVPLLKYSIPVFVQGVALTSMYSTDLLLVKHFFLPEEAGLYAALAILGRVALFGTTPVIHTMFPLVAQRFSRDKPYHNIFYLSVLMVGVISLIVVLFYLFFPRIPVVLYGPQYIEGIPILWWFGVFMSLVSLSMLFTQFYLSIGKTRIVWLFAGAALLQIILIWFIHPTLLSVIQISILCAAGLLFALLVYFPYHTRHGKVS